jgi:AcrR family transcriptional regulator
MVQRDVPPAMAERLRKAAATFAEMGFEAARIDDLSAATDVPSSTIYYYLAGKEGLLEFLLADWLDAVARSVAEAVQGLGDAPAPERLRAVIGAQLGLMRAQPATCRVLLAENGRIARLPDIAEGIQAAFHRPVEKVLLEGQDEGSIRDVDVEVTTAAVYGAVTFAGLHFLVTDRDIAEDLAERLAVMVLGGIGTS